MLWCQKHHTPIFQMTKTANWVLEFLKNETKTFLVLYNIFCLLQMQVSTVEQQVEGYKMCELTF